MPVNAAETKAFADLSKSFISSSDARDRLSSALREHLGVTSRDSFWMCDDGVDDALGPVVIYRLTRDVFVDGGVAKGLPSSSDDADCYRATYSVGGGGFEFGEPVRVKRVTSYQPAELEPAPDEAELPPWLGQALALSAGMTKAAGHRYIRRVPKAGGGYRYFYKVSGGAGGVGHESEFQVGAAFKAAHGGQEGHFHIVGKDADGTLRVKHDESGHEAKLSPAALSTMLRSQHAEAIGSHRDKVARDLADAKASGASPKQVERLQGEAAKHGVPAPAKDAPLKNATVGRYAKDKLSGATTRVETKGRAVGDYAVVKNERGSGFLTPYSVVHTPSGANVSGFHERANADTMAQKLANEHHGALAGWDAGKPLPEHHQAAREAIVNTIAKHRESIDRSNQQKVAHIPEARLYDMLHTISSGSGSGVSKDDIATLKDAGLVTSGSSGRLMLTGGLHGGDGANFDGMSVLGKLRPNANRYRLERAASAPRPEPSQNLAGIDFKDNFEGLHQHHAAGGYSRERAQDANHEITRVAKWHSDMAETHDALGDKDKASSHRAAAAAMTDLAHNIYDVKRNEVGWLGPSMVEQAKKAKALSDKAAAKPDNATRKSVSTVTDPERDLAKSLQASHIAAAAAQPDAGAAAAHREAAGIYEATAEDSTSTREFNAGMAQAGRVAGLVKAWSGIPDQQRPTFAAFRKSMESPVAARGFAFTGSNGTGDALGHLPAVVAGSKPAAEVTTPASPEPTTYSAQRGAVNGMRKSMGAFYGHIAAGAAQQAVVGVRCPPEAPMAKSGGPFIGPHGGKWADAAHTIPWKGAPTTGHAVDKTSADFHQRKLDEHADAMESAARGSAEYLAHRAAAGAHADALNAHRRGAHNASDLSAAASKASDAASGHGRAEMDPERAAELKRIVDTHEEGGVATSRPSISHKALAASGHVTISKDPAGHHIVKATPAGLSAAGQPSDRVHSENRSFGFHGTVSNAMPDGGDKLEHTRAAFDAAVKRSASVNKTTHDAAREMLDGRAGRHLADAITNGAAKPSLASDIASGKHDGALRMAHKHHSKA